MAREKEERAQMRERRKYKTTGQKCVSLILEWGSTSNYKML